MATLEVKSVEHLLGSGVPYAYAVKAGSWIFLTGHEGFDFDAGITEAVAGALVVDGHRLVEAVRDVGRDQRPADLRLAHRHHRNADAAVRPLEQLARNPRFQRACQ